MSWYAITYRWYGRFALELVDMILEEASGLKAEEHFAVIRNLEILREGFAKEDTAS
ncbi:hypothetical protein Elgi_67320 [Paenibacillus elgii]|uniref:hypothetical protein n=1 Tax=Paenibacillus elgii TaxID=189691 RepID=UPI002D7BAD06|nr:hypothetical protein Elgi_67320 [Paenibacillus elgii]